MRIKLFALFFLLAFGPRLFAAGDDDNSWAKISKQFSIGSVTLQLTNLAVHVIGGKVNGTLPWEKPSVEEYFCAVQNPFEKPKMEDGFIVSDANYQVLKDYDDFKASAFRRFAFFTNRPTSIGLLVGEGGADGGSSQTLYLVDVETGTHVCIPLSEGAMPAWLRLGVYPPPFALTCVNGIQNAVIWSPGSQPRIIQVYSFHDGKYRRDLALERQEMTARFQLVQFTLEERRCLSTNESPDELDETVAERLSDFLHYGKFAGQQSAVDRFLKTLRPELRACLTGSRDWIYERNRIDLVDDAEQRAQAGGPTYVYVYPNETLYGIARQWKRYGVTVEGLLAANPGIKAERLQVGQRVMLSAVFKPAETECRVEAVQTAALHGVDYLKLMNQCLAKDRAAISQFFQLARQMDGIAAEEYGVDLQILKVTLGGGYFNDCLSHESTALREIIRELLVDDLESEPKSPR